MTKTHIIAKNLIAARLPSSGEGSAGYVATKGGDAAWSVASRNYNSDPMGAYVKRTCDGCNREWMEPIERSVADTVIALAQGEACDLDVDLGIKLAHWATIVAMLRAAKDGDPETISPQDRVYVRLRNEPPPGYMVWLANGVTRWDFPTRSGLMHDGTAFAHATWFWLGSTAYLVLDETVAQFIGYLIDIESAMTLLWPPTGHVESWRPARSLTVEEMYAATSRLGVWTA